MPSVSTELVLNSLKISVIVFGLGLLVVTVTHAAGTSAGKNSDTVSGKSAMGVETCASGNFITPTEVSAMVRKGAVGWHSCKS